MGDGQSQRSGSRVVGPFADDWRGRLRDILTRHGFESNDDYEFTARCLLEAPTSAVRTLSIAGDGDRRKTAFATALAHALGCAHVLYHDFAARTPPPPEIILPPTLDELGRAEPPIAPLDDIVSKACALSEGETVTLILDQLHVADFREHLRLHRLVRERRWYVGDAFYHANARHLLLFLISEEPLYHALQRHSFRVWIGRVSEQRRVFRPADFGLDASAAPLLEALSALLVALEATPTHTELSKVIDDLHQRISTAEHLRQSLFGRCEGLARERLRTAELEPHLVAVIEHLHRYRGAEHSKPQSG